MLFRSIALIALSTFAVYYFHIRITPSDIEGYNELIAAHKEIKHKRSLTDAPAWQKREGVQKDIWPADESRHIQIQSAHSHLTFVEKEKRIEIIEQLKEIKATLPKDLHFTAHDGIYTYPSHHFTATNPEGTLPNYLHFTADTLLWKKEQNQIHLQGHVKIFSKETQSYAIADNLTYDMEDKTILLTANSHVLFHKEGTSMTAPKLLISLDRSVQTFGDAHLSLTLDEQNSIDELIRNYL